MKRLVLISMLALSACVVACVNDPTVDDSTGTETVTEVSSDTAVESSTVTDADTATATE